MMKNSHIFIVIFIYSLSYCQTAWQDAYVSPTGQKILLSPSGLVRNLPENQLCVFGVGAKTLKKQMLQDFPSAEKIDAAWLPGYRLDIVTYDETLGSPIFEPFPDCGYDIYGVVFSVNVNEIAVYDETHLDYSADTVTVQLLSDQSTISCLVYYPNMFPIKLGYGETFPWYKMPTFDYMRLSLEGMQEAGIPTDYIVDAASLSMANDDLQA